MGTRFVPLSLDLIDEGQFLADANAELLKLQRKLREHREEHGEAANNAKAKLTIEVTLQCLADDAAAFSVKALSKVVLPGRPAKVTLAIGGIDDNRQPCLFVRSSGSTADSPEQAVLVTADGRAVDAETGEVVGQSLSGH